MPRQHRTHTHPCQDCGRSMPCDGTLTHNPDGWPEAVCDLFHREWGINPDFVCEACHEARVAQAEVDRRESVG